MEPHELTPTAAVLASQRFQRGEYREGRKVPLARAGRSPEPQRRGLAEQLGGQCEAAGKHKEAVQAWNFMAWAFATSPDPHILDPVAAMVLAQRVVEKTKQQDPLSLDTLAAAQAASGQFNQAVQTAKAASNLADSLGNKPLAAAISAVCSCTSRENRTVAIAAATIGRKYWPKSDLGVLLMKLVIIGGVAGGASAAARARRLSEDAEIVLFERGPDVSFANCGLPYYVGGAIAQREKLLVTTAERLHARFNLDVRTRSAVEAIDRAAKRVRVRDLASGREYEESYDKLILAPGAAPVRPPIPGIDLPGIYALRNLQDIDQIKARIDGGVKQAVVVGAGFIGLELVENFVRRGVATTLVELQDQVLPPLDKEMTTPIVETLAAKGVTVLLGRSAVGFEQTSDGLVVRLKSGETLPAQIVILGVGVRPENKLAVEAGLEVGPRGGIRVNDRLLTSDPDIYAVGDAIEVEDFVSGEPAQIPLAGPANRQGRIAADNVFGRSVRYRGTQGTAIVGVFELSAAMTGAAEKALRRANRPFRKIYVHPAHHAGYYPGAEADGAEVALPPGDGPDPRRPGRGRRGRR